MITHSKYRILQGLVILLFVLNAATIATLLYHTGRENAPVTLRQGENQSAAKEEQGARYFREQLSLDPAQTDKFRDINRNYNRSTHLLAVELEQLRQEMVRELGQPDSSQPRLDEICRQIGSKHEELKKLTVDYYLKMKSTCSDEQRDKLNTLFRGMVQKEDSVATHKGQGKGPRWRGGRN
jgi:Spy/CpxP family protein refolding chaperone